MSGFLGKIGLMEASASRGTAIDWALIAAGIVTSLLTLYAVIRVWNMAFWQEAPEPLKEQECPNGMTGAAASLVAVTLALTIVAGPLRTFTDEAADQLEARTPYISSVLPEANERGDGISMDAVEDNGATKEVTP